MKYPFRAVSFSYQKAPLAVRELLALDEAACGRLLHLVHHDLNLENLLVLSTCNRTEVYYSAATNQESAIVQALGQVAGVANALEYQAYFTAFDAAGTAAHHLFEVLSGWMRRWWATPKSATR
ncbi:hypothetical protein BEN49_10835 [Hymenobacter coccineus]|uniref:Glutamyl-tRNA reductase N-terminal domain-containing protein n=1 Tax=Hymenobacter coccineus TaxID=1908235 RepID=A0A1G1T8Z2_9BACT|nr:hypothetical protein BEN49_10835 [Hymenobacter coccineus]